MSFPFDGTKLASIRKIWHPGCRIGNSFHGGHAVYEIYVDGNFEASYYYPEEAEMYCEEKGYDYILDYDT